MLPSGSLRIFNGTKANSNYRVMELITKELIQELLAADQMPLISLYMPTHKTHPENLQDVILYKNLLREIKDALLEEYSERETQTHLNPLEALVDNKDIWNHTFEGLAVFSAPNLFKVVRVRKTFEALVMVADRFHTKPLRHYLQSLEHFHVLGLTLHDIRLFKGDRHSLTEVKLSSDIPKTITEALGGELTEKHTTVASYGGAGGGSSPAHHGHGGRKEETEKDAERFFRVVADSIYEHYSKPTRWPLILAALPEHHSLFREVNKNPLLLSSGIDIDPSSVDTDKLAEMAWEIMEPEYILKLDSMVEMFERARVHGKSSDDYKEVAAAAVEGRVDTLLVEADRIISVGLEDLVPDNILTEYVDNPIIVDLLDDLGELVTRMGGHVVILPASKMPSKTGLAAIFRF
jgi:hypothetical protein